MFKTKLIGFAGAAMMFSGMAFGQLCNTGASLATAPGTLGNNIRAEGLTELLPALTLSCNTTGGASSANVLLQISNNVPITSKVTSTSSGATEIALTGGTSTVFGVVTGSVVSFSGVTLPAATPAGLVSFTISYIRVNASTIPAAGVFPGSVGAQAAVQGVTNTTSATTGVLANVAYVYSAINPTTKVYSTSAISSSSTGVVAAAGTAITSSPNYSVCGSLNSNKTSSSDYAGTTFWVGVTENFAGSFKTAAHEQGGSASAVASGTRIKLVFNNVPTGLNIYVPTSVSSVVAGNLAAAFTGSETLGFTAPPTVTSPSAVSGQVILTVSGTTATAIFEVSTDSLSTIDTLAIPVTLSASANTVANYLTNPTMTVTTTLAPQLASATQIPAFSTSPADAATANTVTFKPCITNLLFPFVTNANGFETGIAISNTTKDPFGTTGQSGTCTLNYYASGVPGATNPTAVTAPNLAEGTNQPYLAGETYAFTLTQSLGVNTSNPAIFQGYVIATCNFVDAHAFAYILGGLQPGMFVNPNNTAMGYLALVLSGSSTANIYRGGGTVDTTSY